MKKLSPPPPQILPVKPSQGLHTLCLLDIKVKEPNLEALCRGKKIYEPPRYMTVNTALEQLLEIEASRKQGAYGPETLCIGVARIGADDQKIVAGTMEQLLKVRADPHYIPPHCTASISHPEQTKFGG